MKKENEELTDLIKLIWLIIYQHPQVFSVLSSTSNIDSLSKRFLISYFCFVFCINYRILILLSCFLDHLCLRCMCWWHVFISTDRVHLPCFLLQSLKSYITKIDNYFLQFVKLKRTRLLFHLIFSISSLSHIVDVS